MCICVNCSWVDRCKAYHSVEAQHGVEHLSQTPDIEPRDPLIKINVRSLPEGGIGIEWDVQGCKSFHQDQGRWLRLRPGEDLPT